MKRLLLCLVAAGLALGAAPKPKLVLAIVLDQFRYDYTTRFRSEYTGGFDRLLSRGAVFTNARYVHVPTVTAVGHSTFLTGAIPALSGIVANDWYDRDEGKHVTSVSDDRTQLLGGAGTGSSPRRLLVDTVGDELKMADDGASRVIGISLKDRAAILPAGHMADGAYWFDPASGNFVSSTYYFADLPAWVKDCNAARPADGYGGATWLDHKLPASGRALYTAVEASPFGNDMIERLAENALQAERLGQRGVTDLLAVSFSAHDYVGHSFGPYSPEEHDVSLRADRALERLFQAVEKQVGMDNVLVVLTGDHGVAPTPESNVARRMPGGRFPGNAARDAAQAALVKKYGEGNWIAGSWDLELFLNLDLVAQKNLEPAEVRREAARAVFAMPHVFRVYTRDQLLKGEVLGDDLSRRVMNGFNERRGADIEFIPDPYWIFANGAGTTHGTPFGYDSHVPVIFMGAGIRPGRHNGSIIVNDVASTLATILDVETPSGSVGRVLTEMLQ
ncbi:MAG: alkaline phosphatase family protein [Acidobacteriia bacterium]|nr:alkaline phosphatase family protein [Terriglobia bacterium]